MPIDQTGIAGKIADTLNDMVDQLSYFASEVTLAAREAGS